MAAGSMVSPLAWLGLLAALLLCVCSAPLSVDAAFEVTAGSDGSTDAWATAFIHQSAWVVNNKYPATESGFVTRFDVQYTTNANEEFRWPQYQPSTRSFSFAVMDASGSGSGMTFANAAAPTTGECTSASCVTTYTIDNVPNPSQGKFQLALSGSGLYVKKGQFVAVYTSNTRGIGQDSESNYNYICTALNGAAASALSCTSFNGGYELLLNYRISVQSKSTGVTIDVASLTQSVAAAATVTLPVQFAVTDENPPAALTGLGSVRLVLSSDSGTTLAGSSCTAITAGGASTCTVSFPGGGVFNVLASFVPSSNTVAASTSDGASPAVITVASRPTSLVLQASLTAGGAVQTTFAAGASIVLSAVLTPSTAVGSVTFRWATGGVVALAMDGVNGNAVTVVNGVATLTLPSLLAGQSYSFTADFTPTAASAYDASSSASALAISKAAATSGAVLAGGEQVLDVSAGVGALGGSGAQWLFNKLDLSSVRGLLREVYIAYDSSAFAAGLTALPLRFAVLASSGGVFSAAPTDSLPTGFVTVAGQSNASPLTNPQRIDVSALNIWLEVGQTLAVSHPNAAAVLLRASTGNGVMATTSSSAAASAVATGAADRAAGVWFVAGSAPTSVTISGPGAALAAGTTFTLTAQASPANAAGSVTFQYADGSAIAVAAGGSATVAVDGAGSAIVVVAGLTPGGVRNFRVLFAPTGSFLPSQSTVNAQVTISPVTPTVTLTMTDATMSVIGVPINVRVEVTPAAAGTVRLTRVSDGAVLLGWDWGDASSLSLTTVGAVSQATFRADALADRTAQQWVATFTPASAAEFASLASAPLTVRAGKLATDVTVQVSYTDPPWSPYASFEIWVAAYESLSNERVPAAAGTITIYERMPGTNALVPILASPTENGVASLAVNLPFNADNVVKFYPYTLSGNLAAGGAHQLLAVFEPADQSDNGRYNASSRAGDANSLVTMNVAPTTPNVVFTINPTAPKAGNLVNLTLQFLPFVPDVPGEGYIRWMFGQRVPGLTTNNGFAPLITLNTTMQEVQHASANTVFVLMRVPYDLPFDDRGRADSQFSAQFIPSDTSRFLSGYAENKQFYVSERSTDPTDMPATSSTGAGDDSPPPGNAFDGAASALGFHASTLIFALAIALNAARAVAA